MHEDAGPLVASQPASSRPRLTYVLCALVTWNLFANHWNRDSIGALTIPLETDPLFELSVRQYNSLSAAYFAPNIPVPIIAGVLSQLYGPANVYVGFATVAFLGNLLLAAAALAEPHYGLLLAARVLTGIAYEAVDMVPIGLVAPRFEGSWGRVVGVINGLNRLGSVLNFLLEPVILAGAGGLVAALLLPAALGASMLPCCLAAHRIDAALRRRAATPPDAASATRDSEGGGEDADAAAAAEAKVAPDGVAAAAGAADGAARPSLRVLRDFAPSYWLFLLGACGTYGCVVPFWFIGARHLALRWGMSLAAADAFLLWPEGAIALVAPPLGILIDRWSLERRLGVAAVSTGLIGVALLALAWLPLHPALGVCALGLCYACAQNLIWSAVPLVSPPALLNLSAGLIGCAVNVLPMLLPAVAFCGDGSVDLTTLAVVGACGSAAYGAGACLERRRTRAQRSGRAWLSGSQLPVLPAPEGAAPPPDGDAPEPMAP